MADNRKKIQLYRTETNGSTTTNIIDGELAVNLNSTSPFVMFKDTSGTVQKLGALSTTTGSSVYHTMTQKAITDALTTRKNETDTLVTALNSEIAARKAVDGQSGQTYAENSSCVHISGATSLNNADILLNNAIIAETEARQNAINALDATVNDTNGSLDISVMQTNGLLESISISDIKLSDNYSAVTYPEVDSTTFVSATIGDTLDEAVAKVDQNVATLVQEVLNNEEVISAALTEIKESTGLDENLKYIKDSTATHISGALTLSEADSLLNNAITAETKARQDALTAEISNRATAITNAINELDATVSGNGTHVDVTVTQLNGKITGVSVAESDIASNTKLTNTITSLGINSDGTFTAPTTAQTSGYTSAATSIMDAIIIMDNQIEENETVTAYALTDLNDSLNTLSNSLNTLNSWCAYMSGHTTATSLTSVPTTKRLCIATISSSQTLGVNGSISDGREVHIIVKNSSSNDITITIPSSIVNLVGDNLTISGGFYGEINLVSDGSSIYYRGAS